MEDDTRTWRLRAGGYSSPRVTRPGRLPSRVTGPGCPLFQTRSPVRGTLSACFRGRLCPLAKNITALFSSQDIPCLKRAGSCAFEAIPNLTVAKLAMSYARRMVG
ncbi:uncharacterized protein LOC144134655 isoform X2 [Amblyomma americanum]